MERHGDTCWHLHKAIIRPGENFDRKTFQQWAAGAKLPNAVQSFDMLARVEQRYRLSAGYFRNKLTNTGRAVVGHHLVKLPASERRRLAWHLPEDFDQRPPAERAEILHWIRSVIISGSTDYRRYQAEAMKVRYSLRFPEFLTPGGPLISASESQAAGAGSRPAPARLVRELGDLIQFKTATLTKIGVKRAGVWGEETVTQKIEHFGLMFGAVAGDLAPPISGLGAPLESLTMALLVFPAFWDWYLQWREARRGFYTSWEINMLALGTAFSRRETGWLRQSQWLAQGLTPIPGLVSEDDITQARTDWDAACERRASRSVAFRCSAMPM